MAVTTIPEVIDRLREINSETRSPDGVRTFNRVYLKVTERVFEGLESPNCPYQDREFMTQLDVDFAKLWIDAYQTAKRRDRVPRAWAPLFELRRRRGLLPIQHALAGMNAHIEHDLPLAVVKTCMARRTTPRSQKVRDDYAAVNTVLAGVESEIRQTFLTDIQKQADRHIGPLVHVVSSWNIDKARDLAWVSVEALWALRRIPPLATRYTSALSDTVGMTSRYLLTPL
ncbi:MAG TPA: DUF5995 family protein [Acidimicrobiia bacterium]|nr:DUF5995 family protein [Acidimicrobiia bacterium]